MKKMKRTLRILLGVLVLLLLIAGFRLLPAQNWLERFLDWASGTGYAGMAVFVVVYVIAAVFFLPGSILTLGAGAIFGLFWGTAVVSVGSTLGAGLAFIVGRYLARDRVSRWAMENPKFAAIDAAVGRAGGRIVLLTRLSPLFPYNLLNYLFGLTRVGFWPYFIASWVGMLPATVLYVYLGVAGRAAAQVAAGPGVGTGWEALFWGVGLAATALLTYLLTRIARRALSEQTP
jgi:uncharacterized membrane protein YdjX (TVP38/TMEM64 family)